MIKQHEIDYQKILSLAEERDLYKNLNGLKEDIHPVIIPDNNNNNSSMNDISLNESVYLEGIYMIFFRNKWRL